VQAILQPDALTVKRGQELSDSWSGFLSESYSWDYMCTMTLDGAHSLVGERIFQGHCHRFFYRWFMLSAVRAGGAVQPDPERWIFRGPMVNAYYKHRGKFVYVVGMELQKRGVLHAHALLFIPRYFDHRLDYGDGIQAWDWGICRFEPPRSQGDVSGYVSKYIRKEGDVFLSSSFESNRLVQESSAPFSGDSPDGSDSGVVGPSLSHPGRVAWESPLACQRASA